MNMNDVISLCRSRKGKVTYSMNGSRDVMASTCDCSGMIYSALVRCGAINSLGYWGSTVTERKLLEENGFELVYAGNGIFEAKAGDVFIWAPNGGDRNLQTFTDGDLRASAGSAGHTGIFVDGHNIIHCNYGYNGITENNYDEILGYNQSYYDGGISEFIFRKTGNSSNVIPTTQPDQILEIGSNIVFNNVYRADEVSYQHELWQVRCHALCPNDFAWADNGIPVGPLTETDSKGNATGDQVMENGSYFKINGTYQVLELHNYKNLMWIARINLGGYDVWIDVNTVTEV